MLPLLKKAVGDAGFDLLLGSDAEWERIGVSGLAGSAWVVPAGAGALLALAQPAVLAEFQATSWTDVPLPRNAAGAIRCPTPADLYERLRRVRVLFAQLPPAPLERYRKRLAAIATTEAEAVVKQRVGQDLFCEMLMEYWDGRCAVTGLDVAELLRASHAKPWKDADDHERLDVYNGLLLAVHLDALFDQGLMTFTDAGVAEFSTALTAEARRLLLPDGEELRLRKVAAGHRRYLEYHRTVVFRDSRVERPPA